MQTKQKLQLVLRSNAIVPVGYIDDQEEHRVDELLKNIEVTGKTQVPCG